MLLVLSWIACAVFFSTSYIGASILSKYAMSLEYMMFYRLVVACAILMFAILIRRQRLKILKIELWPSVLVAVSQIGVWLSACGTKYIVSGILACVMVLQIFIAEILASITEKRAIRCKIIISGVLGFMGVALLCNQQFGGTGETASVKNTVIGVMLAIFASFVSAMCNITYEKYSKMFAKMPRLTFLFYNCLFASIMFLILGAIVHPDEHLFNAVLLDMKYFCVMVYLAITATILALLAMYYIIAKQGAVKTTYMNFILPALSMLISTFAEGFRWNLTAVIGMVVLLYGVWIGVREKQEQEERHKSWWRKILNCIM